MKVLYIQDSVDLDMWHSYIKVGDYVHHTGTLHSDSLNEIMDKLLGFNTNNLPEGSDTQVILDIKKAEYEAV